MLHPKILHHRPSKAKKAKPQWKNEQYLRNVTLNIAKFQTLTFAHWTLHIAQTLNRKVYTLIVTGQVLNPEP